MNQSLLPITHWRCSPWGDVMLFAGWREIWVSFRGTWSRCSTTWYISLLFLLQGCLPTKIVVRLSAWCLSMMLKLWSPSLFYQLWVVCALEMLHCNNDQVWVTCRRNSLWHWSFGNASGWWDLYQRCHCFSQNNYSSMFINKCTCKCRSIAALPT